MESKKFKKPTRTISGVAPLTVALPPRRCDHGACTYCPTFKNAPQAYTPESPAIKRAIQEKFDPYNQVKVRLDALKGMGHPTDKIELIIIGGTFPSYKKDFKYDFIKRCYDALNGVDSKDLEEAKKLNETAKHRMVALCVETRPDVSTEKDIKDMLKWGTTRVEIGVQAPDDEIYKKINRCHDVKDVIDSTKRLKVAGFKLGYHLMPGLPGSSPEKDLEMFNKKIFGDSGFRPDQIKIYPCQVVKNSTLEKMYYEGKYQPYSKEVARDIIIDMMKSTPRYCRVMRIMRSIPPYYLVAGIKNLEMRHDIEDEIRARKIEIKEIRFREIGFALRDERKTDKEVGIKVTEYEASEGREFFIEAVNKDDTLFGLVRLRLEKTKKTPAMVRELHVYGPTLELGKEANEEWQHKGLGKELMAKAEEIAKAEGYKSIRVISGVGVREYYYKLGYKLDKKGIYVEKKL